VLLLEVRRLLVLRVVCLAVERCRMMLEVTRLLVLRVVKPRLRPRQPTHVHIVA
jgi:hypothetical protein